MVIFFYEKDDNGVHHLKDSWDQGCLDYTYAVIKVWEKSRQAVIDARLYGLYPLLPLMKGRKQETRQQALKESVGAVQDVDEEELKLDLLAVMAIMAGGKYPAELVLSMIRREMIMESPIFQEWIKEEVAQAEARGKTRGKAEGKAEGKVDSICKYLEVRFGPASKDLQQEVKGISSLTELDRIINDIYRAETLDKAQTVVLGTN